MSVKSQQGQHQQQQQAVSGAEQRVRDYMLDGEEISYSLRFRPIGIVHWIKSLFGYGVTHWFVTNQRVIQETEIGGGFTFKDVTHDKISSIEYGTKVSLLTIAMGILFGLAGLAYLVAEGGIGGLLIMGVGGLLVWYAYWRRRQVLRIQASGGVNLALNFSKGERVDDIVWYLHAERQKSRD